MRRITHRSARCPGLSNHRLSDSQPYSSFGFRNPIERPPSSPENEDYQPGSSVRFRDLFTSWSGFRSLWFPATKFNIYPELSQSDSSAVRNGFRRKISSLLSGATYLSNFDHRPNVALTVILSSPLPIRSSNDPQSNLQGHVASPGVRHTIEQCFPVMRNHRCWIRAPLTSL